MAVGISRRALRRVELSDERRASELWRIHRLHGRECRRVHALFPPATGKEAVELPPSRARVPDLRRYLVKPANAWLCVGIAYAAYKTRGFREKIEFAELPSEE